jgi:hypothetical protein
MKIATLENSCLSIWPANHAEWISTMAAAHAAIEAIGEGTVTVDDAMPTIRAAQASCIFASENWRTQTGVQPSAITFCGIWPQVAEAAIDYARCGCSADELAAFISDKFSE